MNAHWFYSLEIKILLLIIILTTVTRIHLFAPKFDSSPEWRSDIIDMALTQNKVDRKNCIIIDDLTV